MPIFVIHEHHARNLHWDLRLEMGGVLKSWALPKSPPRTEGIKRLAIQVNDHLRSYANFEGEIDEGYGKGIVKIWDKGKYRIEEKTPDKLVIEIEGKVLKGKYVLIRTKYHEKDNSWIFFKLSNPEKYNSLSI